MSLGTTVGNSGYSVAEDGYCRGACFVIEADQTLFESGRRAG